MIIFDRRPGTRHEPPDTEITQVHSPVELEMVSVAKPADVFDRDDDTNAATFGLFSGTGFTEDLVAEAARSHGRILLAGLKTLYGLGDAKL